MKKRYVLTGLCICLQFWALAQNIPTKTYQFASKPSWADEFNKNGLPDSTKWNYDVGGHGWSNNELQYYTEKKPKNAVRGAISAIQKLMRRTQPTHMAVIFDTPEPTFRHELSPIS